MTVGYEVSTGATVTVSPADSDGSATGHQVAVGLTAGSNEKATEITISVTSNGSTLDYTIVLTRVDVAALSSDASLSSLSFSGIDIGTFESSKTSYEADVLNSFSETTLSYTTSDAGAKVTVNREDSDSVTNAYEIALLEGANVIHVNVRASDGETRKRYTVRINRAPTAGWLVLPDFKEIEVHPGTMRAIWSDGTTLWITVVGSSNILAYDLATMMRESSRDIDGGNAGDDASNGIWSDGDIVAVSDNVDDKIYVFDLTSGSRRRDLEFDLADRNAHSKGL